MRQVYGISFNNDANWTIRYSLAEARKLAKEKHGRVRSLSLRLWNDCGQSMDYPTFYAQSKFVCAYGNIAELAQSLCM